MNQDQSTALRALVLSAVGEHVNTGLALAEILHRVYTGTVEAKGGEVPLVESWGHDDFHSYAEHELGMHGGNALRYVRIHELLVKRFNAKDLPQSITKLGQLARVAKMEPRVLSSWIAKAHKLSCCELEHAINDHFGFAEGKRRVIFQLTRSHGDSLHKKVAAAKESLGSDTLGEALFTIVREWETGNGKPGSKKAAAAEVRRLSVVTSKPRKAS